MSAPQFKAGDRVVARTTAQVMSGTCGAVQRLAYTVPDAYVVLFDGWAEPCVMSERDLELIDSAPPEREQVA